MTLVDSYGIDLFRVLKHLYKKHCEVLLYGEIKNIFERTWQ